MRDKLQGKFYSLKGALIQQLANSASQAPKQYFKFHIVIRNNKKPENCALKNDLNSTVKFGTYMQVHIIEAFVQAGFFFTSR